MKCYKFVGTEEDLDKVTSELHKAARAGCLIVIDAGYSWRDRDWWKPLSNAERLVYSAKGVKAYYYHPVTQTFKKAKITL